MGYASDIIECDERTLELPNAAVHMKQDANNIEKRPLNLRLRLGHRPRQTYLASHVQRLLVPISRLVSIHLLLEKQSEQGLVV